jgi:hypothetical protein
MQMNGEGLAKSDNIRSVWADKSKDSLKYTLEIKEKIIIHGQD